MVRKRKAQTMYSHCLNMLMIDGVKHKEVLVE